MGALGAVLNTPPPYNERNHGHPLTLLFELILAGGWVIWPILAASVAATAIIVERSWSLRTELVVPAGLSTQVRNLCGTGRMDPEQAAAIRRASHLGAVLVTAAEGRAAGEDREMLSHRCEQSGRQAVHQMERNLDLLGNLASVCPLLGILGTVIGMIKVFGALTSGGLGDPDALAGGIAEALLTTAVGIGVAIPALLMHGYFERRVTALSMRLEREAGSFVDWLLRAGAGAEPAAAPADKADKEAAAQTAAAGQAGKAGKKATPAAPGA